MLVRFAGEFEAWWLPGGVATLQNVPRGTFPGRGLVVDAMAEEISRRGLDLGCRGSSSKAVLRKMFHVEHFGNMTKPGRSPGGGSTPIGKGRRRP